MREVTSNILLAIIVVSSFSLGFMFKPLYEDILSPRFTSYKVMEDMDARTETFRMWNELKEFWYFNESNIRNKLTQEELKEEGGVCWHYSDWYVEEAKKKGLMGKKIEFWGSGEVGHSVAIIYDKDIDQYCLVDQTSTPKCNKLENTFDE
jgi:hypothetical protein